MKYDIYLLQDTHLTEKKEPYFNSLWRGKTYHSFGTFNSRGTAILVNSRVQHDILYKEQCPEGNYILCVIKLHGSTFTLLNIYGPNEDKPSFFRHLGERLQNISCENLIVGGDFNFVLDLERDSNYRRQNNPGAREAFIELVEEEGLTDIWSKMNPGKRAFTWSKLNPHKFGRLDMLFVSEHLADFISDCSIIPGYRSDHSIVSLNMKVPQLKRGPGLWKFNNSLLEDKLYENTITELIIDTVYQYAVPVYEPEFIMHKTNFDQIQFTISDHIFYETLLMLIRGETVKFSKRKARASREKEEKLNTEIARIRADLHDDTDQEKLRDLEKAQQKLEEFRKQKIQGLITRSKVDWYEEGEKCTKYFLSLEKRNSIKKSVHTLKVDNCIVTDKTEILKYFSENLKKKYLKTSTEEPSRYLRNHIQLRLSEDEKAELDKPISLCELKLALMNMKKGKTPGSNGFTSDFFKHFWGLLGTFLYRAWTERFAINKNLNSHNESIVTLIPKSGVAHDSPKGWRPISLLNVDFKIISAAVASRLKSIIDKIISPCQTAYIQGRFIGENSRLLYDVIEHLNSKQLSGLIVGVDFESAFDTVSWEFLLETIEKYNFGQYFKKLINVLYLNTDLNSRILLDGDLGTKIFMGRGIRQGDPISGYLFNLVMEPLTNCLNLSPAFDGIYISNKTEARVSQYADDLIVFSSPSIRSVKGILDELGKFSEVSGLKVNVQKTKCLPIGSQLQNELLVELGITVVHELKILGITYGKTNDDILSKNFRSIIPKIKNEIAQWQRRHLSFIGKITVIKSLLMSKFVHIFTALPNPEERTIKEINSILFRFIWNNGPDKIKRSVVVQDYHEGGLRMIDIRSFALSLKTTWLKRLYWAPENAAWANLAREILPDIERLVCYSSTKLKNVANGIKNQFWKDVIHAWSQFCKAYVPSKKEVLTDLLWFSDNTKYKNSIVKAWNSKGFRFISDVFNVNDGSLLSKEVISSAYHIKMTFLCYRSLVKSLPFNHAISTEDDSGRVRHPIMPFKISFLSKKIQLSKKVYSTLVKTLRVNNPTAVSKLETKWIRDVGQMYEGTLHDIRSATKNTYLHALHYKIINRIVATKTFLYRIGRAENTTCTLCRQENETLLHAFYSCEKIQRFICELKCHALSKYGIELSTISKLWFFPQHDTETKIEILLKLIAKYTIMRSRTLNRQPDIELFTALLKEEALKEKGAAIRSRTNNKFENKWGNVISVLQNTNTDTQT